MQPPISLEKKLLSSVFVIVTILILLTTALVTWLENRRHQKMELERLFYETKAVKSQVAPLLSQSKLGLIRERLLDALSVNPNILYFTVSDVKGNILLSDDSRLNGKSVFLKATIQDLSHPIYLAVEQNGNSPFTGRFRIYYAGLNEDIYEGGKIRAKKGETVFDTHWVIQHNEKTLGRLRIGFSGKALRAHLTFLIGGMLGTSFFVLISTLLFIFWRVRRNLKPLGIFVKELSVLADSDSSEALRNSLAEIRFKEHEEDVEEIYRLKQAFLKLKDRFVFNWDQLENHRLNLEQMVENRTRELNHLNIKLVRQIEERKEIETRLLNVQKLEAISTLAGGIAHEFNNLFMAITGYASLIQKQSPPDHPNINKAEKIRQLVDNGSESIKQLLGFAKGGKYSPGPINLNEVFRINLEMFMRTRKDIKIQSRFASDLWVVVADRSQMEHVIMNLLINASEAMPGKGVISIETHNIVLPKKQISMDRVVSGKFIHISICDQGKGIDNDLIPRIFDPFFTTKSMSLGTGLGLASVYGIVDNHGGFTTVESTVGKGTTFNIFLPASEKMSETKE